MPNVLAIDIQRKHVDLNYLFYKNISTIDQKDSAWVFQILFMNKINIE